MRRSEGTGRSALGWTNARSRDAGPQVGKMTASAPAPGRIALVRQRNYLIEKVTPPPSSGEMTLVDLSCVDDDAQGQPLSVLWEGELDAEVREDDGWDNVAAKDFDDPALFAAYLRTRSWNCVTATDPTLFQAPFRAGIRIDAYQLEPLRKALRLPRVNLFIADDVGLGKTIEAGLIIRELLLRRRIKRMVVACPPAMLEQWQDEMAARFGLSFVILDRDYLAQKRRERGFSINPWHTHSRFLISHRLLVNEAYAAGLRDWLGEFASQTLLVLDEAHNVAPASSSRYAIDSQITRAIRDIAPRFEHRLFLSATPHNGHSNSFSALLEILDPQRFCRGVKVLKGQLDEVLVRRLKSDIRELAGGFPKRNVVRIAIDGLPADAPELTLPRMLDEYRTLREGRLKDAARSEQTAGALVIGGLQKRLLSSIDAFAKTLAVHRKSVARALEKADASPPLTNEQKTGLEQLTAGIDASAEAADLEVRELEEDDEPPGPPDEDGPDLLERDLEDLMAAGTAASSDGSRKDVREALESELALVDEMAEIADAGRHKVDRRVSEIVDWIGENMCPELRGSGDASPQWNDRRLIIFTEYGDTQRWLHRCLDEAIAHSDRASERIMAFTGMTSRHRREDIKHAFNSVPEEHPLRILIATDAAREGLNLQRHCRDLFHFDLPWNPSRIDQRNGRIDRKLQPADEVFCRYFVFTQRPEDRVLEVLVEKIERIREELGSAAMVLERRILKEVGKEGIRRDAHDELAARMRDMSAGERQRTVDSELEDARDRQNKLHEQVETLRRHLDKSRAHVGFNKDQFRQTLSMGLKISGAAKIKEMRPADDRNQKDPNQFSFPADSPRLVKDPNWAEALDSLRVRRKRGEKIGEWRRRAPIRPIVFEDTGRLGEKVVQLHLEHRVARRLLGRFSAQGMIHHDLSKACLAVASEAKPRVVLLGRLALYGPQAARLHEEIVVVTAGWSDPERREKSLVPYGKRGEQATLVSLQKALDGAERDSVSDRVQERLHEAARRDIEELRPHLEKRADGQEDQAKKRLNDRCVAEKRSMVELLERQRKRIEEMYNKDYRQEMMDFDQAEKRQMDADRKAWERRLDAIEDELKTEPRRIADTYTVQARHIEPVGLIYLWPKTG